MAGWNGFHRRQGRAVPMSSNTAFTLRTRRSPTARRGRHLWLAPGAAAMLGARLLTAADWCEGSALPQAALLCHDGMGMAGPARAILAAARAARQPTLFTGHVPAGSPGDRMLADGCAQWLRLPTHPTLPENVALVAGCGATTVLGHSCEQSVLDRLRRKLPSLRSDVATGDRVDIGADAHP